MNKIIYISIFIAIIISHGCKNDVPTPDKNMDNMVAPNGFTFKTTRDVSINIIMPQSINFTELRSRFNIYTNNPENGGKLISSGSFDGDGSYSGTIKIPSTITELTVTTIAGSLTVEVPPAANYKEDGVIIDFGDDYGYNPPDTIEPTKKNGQIQTYSTSNNRLATSTNMVSNGDFETDDFGTIQYWSSSHPTNARWYFTQNTGSMEWFNDGGNHVIRTPWTETGNNYFGGTSQMVDASPGDVITMSADIKSVGNNSSLYSWLYLIPVNSSGSALAFYNLQYYHPTDTWTNKTLTATMPTGTVEVNVLVWTNDYTAEAAVYADNVIVTGPVVDTDGDGVDDDLDDYPTDATRAFNVYYPNESDWGTFAFEDLWPGKGDYDFNDLILDYQFKSVLNSSNGLVEFFTDYSVRAIGASLTNGFAFMIDGDPTNVASITGTNITENYLSLNANGTEQNQTNTVVFLFDNAFSMIGSSGGSFINTVENGIYVEPVINTLHVSYINAVPNTGLAPYNPFIVVDQTRGIEIHLAGQEPTSLADQALFGTSADDSNPGSGKYYQTVNNLPWAIDLPVKFDYPVEQVQIIEAYNYFQNWGESGGSTYTDWYENNSGYRNNENVYTPPE
ncbi:MAG: LruC domain-containing protein [Bacteroidota bacterium]